MKVDNFTTWQASCGAAIGARTNDVWKNLKIFFYLRDLFFETYVISLIVSHEKISQKKVKYNAPHCAFKHNLTLANMNVSSELYSEFDYETNTKPSVSSNNVVSKFYFASPAAPLQLDSDGDLVVHRRSSTVNSIEIEHSKSTDLSLVGLQVWRGALLLADWLLHIGTGLPKNGTVLELGSGTGLTSIIAGLFSNVICTDVDKGEILKLLKSNVERNKLTTKYPVIVRELDFTRCHTKDSISFDLDSVRIIIAADVIYDNNLTEDFVKTLQFFLSHSSVECVYVALEKRYVFTTADLDVSAPCYDFFVEYLQQLKVTVNELPLDFPQYFRYDRVKELTLLKITRTRQ